MAAERKKRRPISLEAMRLRLADLCARSEQCEYDLRQKIYRAGLSTEDSDEIISFLKANRYLDERRFARAYCNDKVKFSGWGVHKIRDGLRAKRVPQDVINEAIEAIDRKEYVNKMKQLGIALARQLDLRDYDEKAKFYRRMASRGFESSLITKLADAILRKMSE